VGQVWSVVIHSFSLHPGVKTSKGKIDKHPIGKGVGGRRGGGGGGTGKGKGTHEPQDTHTARA